MGGIESGELLRLAAEAGFDALLTNDRGLEHEQNPSALPIAIVVIRVRANTIEAIRPTYGELLAVLARLGPCEFVKLSAS